MRTPATRNSGCAEQSTVQLDSFQRPIADRLSCLARRLERRESTPSWLRWWDRIRSLTGSTRMKGLYLWGGVGRGKTCLMDSFFAQVRISRKSRMHFHQFMQMIHQQLRDQTRTENPLQVITKEFARDTKLLCCDEFVVSDIGDAMILSELLRHMFAQGIVLIATSNIEPQDLYKNGLQRRRFLSSIELLQNHCDVIHLDGPIDYRLQTLRRTKLYRIGTKLTSQLRIQDMLLFGGDATESMPILRINHREFQTVYSVHGMIGFTFDELCIAPRSAADYIEIARIYHTLFLYEVPQLTFSLEDAATRFISLIDVLYDYNVNFVVQAEVSLKKLYIGTRSKEAFDRTASRIYEMASEDFLARAHRA